MAEPASASAPMRFTVQLPTDRVGQAEEFLSAEAIAVMARGAEDAGFDACFVTDHPIPADRWLATGGHHALDPFVALSFAAAATRRIRLQTHVLVGAYRNPFLAAKAVASLDVLSGGRVIVGLAAGYLQAEFEALGVPFDERNELADEAIEVMRRAWSEDGIVHEGHHFRASGNTALPRPLQERPPIWIGGNSRRAIRRAVELADGWLPFPAPRKMAARIGTAAMESLDDLRAGLDYAVEHAAKVGRATPLDVCFSPFGLDMRSDGLPEPAAFRDQVGELQAIGVTWVVASLPAESRNAYLERLAWFGEEVIAPRAR
jgi:probable F420-dependent oxidoreductase